MSKKQEGANVDKLPDQKELRSMRNWHEWLQFWDKAETLEQKLGLLHVGFDVEFGKYSHDEPRYTWVDRVLFYLKVANGFDKPNESLQKMLAKKAFVKLSLHFFKERIQNPKDNYYHGTFGHTWETQIMSDPLFSALIDFFRVEKRYSNFSICNLCYPHKQKLQPEKFAVAFLILLAEYILIWEKREISQYKPDKNQETAKWNADMRKKIDSAKPWLMEVLVNLDGGLAFLKKYIDYLDEICVNKLKEIALRSKLRRIHTYHLVTEDRLVKSIEEALMAESEVALLLIEHRTKSKERARLQRIFEAERVKRDTDQTIEELIPSG